MRRNRSHKFRWFFPLQTSMAYTSKPQAPRVQGLGRCHPCHTSALSCTWSDCTLDKGDHSQDLVLHSRSRILVWALQWRNKHCHKPTKRAATIQSPGMCHPCHMSALFHSLLRMKTDHHSPDRTHHNCNCRQGYHLQNGRATSCTSTQAQLHCLRYQRPPAICRLAQNHPPQHLH